MSKMRRSKGFRRNWWWGVALLAGPAVLLGMRVRKRPNIRCAYR
jgi:hypothetical protein